MTGLPQREIVGKFALVLHKKKTGLCAWAVVFVHREPYQVSGMFAPLPWCVSGPRFALRVNRGYRDKKRENKQTCREIRLHRLDTASHPFSPPSPPLSSHSRPPPPPLPLPALAPPPPPPSPPLPSVPIPCPTCQQMASAPKGDRRESVYARLMQTPSPLNL